MKVGIVSQFGNENLGNKLQNYALQQYLLNYADSVITIKNKPKAKNVVDYLRRFTFVAESEWVNRLCGKPRKTEFLRFHNRYIRDTRASYRIDRKKFSLKKQIAVICIAAAAIRYGSRIPALRGRSTT